MAKLLLNYTLDTIRARYHFGAWSSFRAPLKPRPFRRWTISRSSFYFRELWLVWTVLGVSLLIIATLYPLDHFDFRQLTLIGLLAVLGLMVNDKYTIIKTELNSLQDDLSKERQTQAEIVLHLYRFAAFGRIASGVFHDLANPLTTVSMSLEELREDRPSEDLILAIEGTERMRRFIEMARRQLQQQEHLTYFSSSDEINQSLAVLNYRAKKRRVLVAFAESARTKTYGNPIKFQQVLTNLIGNAIDSYDNTERLEAQRVVKVEELLVNDVLSISITDYGSGIRQSDLEHIFKPFFTTKNAEIGTGIGLSITREIIERDFGGQIKVESVYGQGSNFTFTVPVRPRPAPTRARATQPIKTGG